MYVAARIKEQLGNPVTQADIHDASVAACNELPAGVMRDACDAFVEQYGEPSLTPSLTNSTGCEQRVFCHHPVLAEHGMWHGSGQSAQLQQQPPATDTSSSSLQSIFVF